MIYLASGSPRRKQLIQNIPLASEVLPLSVEEPIIPDEAPKDTVLRLSALKAVAGAASVDEQHIVIGADTVVSFSGKTLGKPSDEQDARRMLNLLQGNVHQVYTGVTVLCRKKGVRISEFVKTDVTFLPMTDREISWYIASGEPMDKAGAYGIQDIGSLFISRISGDYFNVVGLPVSALYNILKENFPELFEEL